MIGNESVVLDITLHCMYKEISRQGMFACWIVEHDEPLPPRFDERGVVQVVRHECRVHRVGVGIKPKTSARHVNYVATESVLKPHPRKLANGSATRENDCADVFRFRLTEEIGWDFLVAKPMALDFVPINLKGPTIVPTSGVSRTI